MEIVVHWWRLLDVKLLCGLIVLLAWLAYREGKRRGAEEMEDRHMRAARRAVSAWSAEQMREPSIPILAPEPAPTPQAPTPTPQASARDALRSPAAIREIVPRSAQREGVRETAILDEDQIRRLSINAAIQSTLDELDEIERSSVSPMLLGAKIGDPIDVMMSPGRWERGAIASRPAVVNGAWVVGAMVRGQPCVVEVKNTRPARK